LNGSRLAQPENPCFPIVWTASFPGWFAKTSRTQSAFEFSNLDPLRFQISFLIKFVPVKNENLDQSDRGTFGFDWLLAWRGTRIGVHTRR
jgi:hypothetical protein